MTRCDKARHMTIAKGLLGLLVGLFLHVAKPLACNGSHEEDEFGHACHNDNLSSNSQLHALAEDVRDGLGLSARISDEGQHPSLPPTEH